MTRDGPERVRRSASRVMQGYPPLELAINLFDPRFILEDVNDSFIPVAEAVNTEIVHDRGTHIPVATPSLTADDHFEPRPLVALVLLLVAGPQEIVPKPWRI